MAHSYNIEHGLVAVETLLLADLEHASLLLPIIQDWRGLMAHPQIDEGRVILELSLDSYAGREIMIPGTPLNDCRSLKSYQYWRLLEGYTQDQRFFDLCVER
jgi:hypothetical protein